MLMCLLSCTQKPPPWVLCACGDGLLLGSSFSLLGSYEKSINSQLLGKQKKNISPYNPLTIELMNCPIGYNNKTHRLVGGVLCKDQGLGFYLQIDAFETIHCPPPKLFIDSCLFLESCSICFNEDQILGHI